jgi:hypothetical protein
MKTIIHLSVLFCLFAFICTQAVGMGYPQDMFADHLTAKKEALASKSGSHPKKKTERKTIKNDCAGKTQQGVCSRGLQTTGCAHPKTTKGQAAKSERLIPPVGRISVIVLKVFHLDGKVEECVMPMEEWRNQAQVNYSFKSFIQTLGKHLLPYLPS